MRNKDIQEIPHPGVLFHHGCGEWQGSAFGNEALMLKAFLGNLSDS